MLQENNKIQVYDNQPIRTAWDEENEEWYFSIVDVVKVLTESKDANAYWRKLKQRLIEEGNETVTKCHGLKMKATDGKRRMTDIANTEQLLRIIQSIPSKKAEPFKIWLAQVGRERIEEIIDPELTDEWQSHGVEKGKEYAILTDEVTKAWSGMNTRQYKKLKGLKKENLRDNMSTLELALNMLAEATTTELTKTQNPQGLNENRNVARTGGKIAGEARERIEKETGNPVITSKNAVSLNSVVTGMIEGVIREESDLNNEK